MSALQWWWPVQQISDCQVFMPALIAAFAVSLSVSYGSPSQAWVPADWPGCLTGDACPWPSWL